MHDTIDNQADLNLDLVAHRRAVLSELVRTGLPGTKRYPQGRGRLAGRTDHRPVLADPPSDAELRDRIRGRLDRLVSHPGAIEVQVEDGVVRLTGRVLAKECDGLLEQLQRIWGVRQLVNAMTAHDHPREIAGRSPAAVPMTAASR